MRTDIFHHTPNNAFDGLDSAFTFNKNGTFCGNISEVTPEVMLKLGYACAATSKRIAISASTHTTCELLMYAFLSGAGFAGAHISKTDADFFALAAHTASVFNFDITLFAEYDGGKLRIHFIENHGLPIPQKMQNEINSKYNKRFLNSTTITDYTLPRIISGTSELLFSNTGHKFSSAEFPVSVLNKSASSKTLKLALSHSGCKLFPEEKGVILIDISTDGMQLRIRDEKGNWHDEAHIAAVISFIYFSEGNKNLVVPQNSPSVMEQIASESDGKILKLGRDQNALASYLKQTVFKNAVSDAVYLCSYLSRTNEKLFSLMQEIPDFTMISKEIHINSDQQKIISELTKAKDGLYKENIDSLRICTDGGWINISPSGSGRSLKVTAESFNEEIASELCNVFIERTAQLDVL